MLAVYLLGIVFGGWMLLSKYSTMRPMAISAKRIFWPWVGALTIGPVLVYSGIALTDTCNLYHHVGAGLKLGAAQGLTVIGLRLLVYLADLVWTKSTSSRSTTYIAGT
jgi:hypothetical protein